MSLCVIILFSKCEQAFVLAESLQITHLNAFFNFKFMKFSHTHEIMAGYFRLSMIVADSHKLDFRIRKGVGSFGRRKERFSRAAVPPE